MMENTSDDEHDTSEQPEEFYPSSSDAIVGWARQNFHHEGNQKLRGLVRAHAHNYLTAKTKKEKTEVIHIVLVQMRKDSPTGLGLVRKDPKTQRWSYIGLDKAKDKIGHALRKAARDYTRRNATKVKTTRVGPMQRSPSSNSLGGGATTARSVSFSECEEEEDCRFHNSRGRSSMSYYAKPTAVRPQQNRGYYAPPGPHGYYGQSYSTMHSYPYPPVYHDGYYYPRQHHSAPRESSYPHPPHRDSQSRGLESPLPSHPGEYTRLRYDNLLSPDARNPVAVEGVPSYKNGPPDDYHTTASSDRFYWRHSPYYPVPNSNHSHEDNSGG
eukprot:Nitzschia sp. Nitz4//scaffold139_size61406//11604//12694//NITZ4_006448-RA/size61406-exonerate_est2genome-gene-0.39-mRNA-1//-1//CDS//3329535816//1409//frame0